MKLHEPVLNFRCESYPNGDVTQWFGENKPLYAQVCNPAGCLTGGHNGIDIVREYGTPIFCVDDGIVVEVLNKETGYGQNVRVLSDSGFEYIYAHLSGIAESCNLGERINAGDPIGFMGNSGFVVSGDTVFWKGGANQHKGTHLHLGRRPLKRWDGTGQWTVTYMSGTPQEIRGNVIGWDNGTFGCVPITAEDFGFAAKDPEVQDITDTIAKVQEVAEKQTDPTIKSAFAKVVENLLQRLINLVK